MSSLRTERLLLRRPTPEDLAPWMGFLVTDRAQWLGGAQGEGRAWRIAAIVLGHWQIHGYGPYLVEDRTTGRPIATIGPFFPSDWPERELGWAVWSEADEGQGYAHEAARAVLRHLYHDLGWAQVVSYIHPDNVRSIALAERLGAGLDREAARPDPSDLVYRHNAELAA